MEFENYETNKSDDDVDSVDEDNEWVEDHGDNSDGDYNDTDDSEDENDGEAQGNGAVRDAVEFLKKTRCTYGQKIWNSEWFHHKTNQSVRNQSRGQLHTRCSFEMELNLFDVEKT